MITIPDNDFIDMVYRWNLSFFDARVKATKRDEDVIKLESILANEKLIKEKALEYLNYWRDFKHSLYGTALSYVDEMLRDYMETTTFTIPKEEDDEYYNNTPLLWD